MIANLTGTFKKNFILYCCEAVGLGIFMFCAGLADVIIDHPGLPINRTIHLAVVRRFLIGLLMGLTALYILNSRFGKKSGAHINPSVTLVQYRLGNISAMNAIFYILSQFIGGSIGMYIIYVLMPNYIKSPTINYIVTQPSGNGVVLAFVLEILSGEWKSFWLYCVAPPLGMVSAELFVVHVLKKKMEHVTLHND